MRLVVVPKDTPPLNTSYAVTPTLSVLAVQLKVKLVWVMLLDTRPKGMLGACVSAAGARVVACKGALFADVLPTASMAVTVIE